MSNFSHELWKILDDFHDYVAGGYRLTHSDPPAHPPVSRRGTGSASSARSRNDRGRDFSGSGETDQADQRDLRAREHVMAEVRDEVSTCRKCRLHEGRRNTVPGMGVMNPLVMVIGEGPGAEEDRTGLPFVGPAGQYLDKWLAAIELSRTETCYIANIVKCRPPDNRDPAPDEADACIDYLNRQIDILRPRAILTVGRIASCRLIGSTDGVGRLRAKVYEYRGIPLIPTYHPSGVLRNPEYRQAVWDDLRDLKRLLG